jgi:hypothetical protein
MQNVARAWARAEAAQNLHHDRHHHSIRLKMIVAHQKNILILIAAHLAEDAEPRTISARLGVPSFHQPLPY